MLQAASAYIERDGKVLTIEREGGNFKGFRSMPHGMVEVGETPEAAAVRETMEETGFDVKIIRKIAETDAKFKDDDKKYPGLEVHIEIFECEIIGGELMDDMKPEWIEKEELMKREEVVPTLKIALEES